MARNALVAKGGGERSKIRKDIQSEERRHPRRKQIFGLRDVPFILILTIVYIDIFLLRKWIVLLSFFAREMHVTPKRYRNWSQVVIQSEWPSWEGKTCFRMDFTQGFLRKAHESGITAGEDTNSVNL